MWLLLSLGFTLEKAAGGYFIADHPASGCRLVYPANQETEGVSPAHQGATRHFLDAFGVLDRDRFEEALNRAALAG
ncbi:MAG: hypothetical protein K2W96_15605 [Gemmataceae bacterium]|nr:hypothetical protein [Gemmataceae bacterium]